MMKKKMNDDKWEYQLMMFANERGLPSVQEGLNATGDQGWELVFIYPDPTGAAFTVFVFKKRKT
jgi:hypothetical protein